MLLTIVASILGLFSLLFLWGSLAAVKRKDFFGLTSHLAMSFLSLSVAGLLAMGALSLRGYAAFTHEELAAEITIDPIDATRFYAKFKYPDGREGTYLLSGNELYVDAHILKWQPIGNLIGLTTSFQLHRVAGRYITIEDEQSKPRTIYSLSEKNNFDLFNLRKQFPKLGFLVDTEYGSATFIPAGQEAEKFALLVSTTGLLIRKLPY